MTAKTENLVPLNERTKEEQRRIATAGGKASGVARAKKRTMREIAEMIGSMEVKDEKILEIMRENGFEGVITQDIASFFAMYKKAQSGDPAAMKFIAEMRGQYSTRVEVEPVQPKPLIDLTEGEKK